MDSAENKSLRSGVIAELRINDAIRLTFEYEGDLKELFERMDDAFENYRKVMEHRYPYDYEPIFKRWLRKIRKHLS